MIRQVCAWVYRQSQSYYQRAGAASVTTHSLFKHTSQASGECTQGETKVGHNVAQRDNAIWQNHDEE